MVNGMTTDVYLKITVLIYLNLSKKEHPLGTLFLIDTSTDNK